MRPSSFGSGWPSSAGGRLAGSLAGLPYALAEAEQNFLVPTREQALIWGDLVPQIDPERQSSALVERQLLPDALGGDCTCVTGPRSWPRRRWTRRFDAQVLEVLARPGRSRPGFTALARLLERGDVPAALAEVTPSELFVLAKEMLVPKARTRRRPGG